MSSVRSGKKLSRRSARDVASSPYKRPAAKQPQASWSLKGLLNYMNPFSWTAPQADTDDSEAARALARRGAQMAEEQDVFSRLPERTPEEEPSVRQANPVPQSNGSLASSSNISDPHEASARQLAESLNANEIGIEPDQWESIRVYLNERQGQKLHTIEAAGIVAVLNKGLGGTFPREDEQQEPFRFSTTSPTPEPGSSLNSNATSPDAQSPDGSHHQPRMLAKNPNGTYRWKGGGASRKRPRNRYQSPGFGSMPSSTSSIRLSPEKPKTDTKRRRIGEEAETSAAQRVPILSTGARPTANSTTQPVAGPSTMFSPSTNGTPSSPKSAAPQTNGVKTPPPAPRLRTPAPFKPSTPVVPSPLRQTWGQSGSSSPPQPSPPSVKPTRAADFMTQLLKDVTPPRKNDFVNPYQAANPLPVRPPAKKPPPRKAKATAASRAVLPATPEKTQNKQKDLSELSPQAIISATVPKGSKRARPPADFKAPATKSTVTSAHGSTNVSAGPRRSARLKSPSPPPSLTINGKSKVIRHDKQSRAIADEGADEGEEAPSALKKQKRSPVNGVSSASSIPGRPSASLANGRSESFTVAEVQDTDLPSTSRSLYTLPSEVVEPSESGSAKEKNTTSPTSATAGSNPFGSSALSGSSQRVPFVGLKTSAPRAPSKLRFSIQADKEEKEQEAPVPTPASAPATSASSSSSFQAPPTPLLKPAQIPVKEPKAFVCVMAVRELPTYSFDFPMSSPGAGPSSQQTRKEVLATPISSLPTFDLFAPALSKPAAAPAAEGFNWAAAGMKMPATSLGSNWTCGVCMLSNPASATEQCTVCEAPRSDKPKAAVSQGFNWAAAGAAEPPKAGGTTWTCNTCMLKNPPSATTKCFVCDTPR